MSIENIAPCVCLEMDELENDRRLIVMESEVLVMSYRSLQQQVKKLEMKLASFTNQPVYILPFLKPGRLVKVVIHFLNCFRCILFLFLSAV